ncbi:MAG TPA: hypothetical protein VGX96_07450 [Candidatus Elarobacter sp.]|nr:hypothetical protein [Candidatus Elarobacter sp.]
MPLYVEKGPSGEPRLGIDVTIGARTLRLMFSTGTTGVHVLAKALPPGSAERTRVPGATVFDGGLLLHAEQARAPIRFPGAEGVVPILIGLVDAVDCVPSQPNCAAAKGGTPEMFGGLFPGVLGAADIYLPNLECCQNPFNSFGFYNQRYVVHANFRNPSVMLDPDERTKKAFSMLGVVSALTPLGCLRIAGRVTNEVCGEIFFDTGKPGLEVETSGPVAPAPLPPGTTATLTVNTWSHTYAVGGKTGLPLLVRDGGSNRIVVGLAALQSVDMLYDLRAEDIGLRSLDRGVPPASKPAAPLPKLLGRWRCKSREWPYWTSLFTFAADRTGTRTVLLKSDRGPVAIPFTYFRLDDSSIVTKEPGGPWGQYEFRVHGDALDLHNGLYWHESHWTASSMAERYACRRAAVSFGEPGGARRMTAVL